MSSASSYRNNRQSGAALILALVVVTIVVIVAASITSDFLLAMRRVENQLQSQQAYAYLRGAEIMARQVLQTDFKEANDIDHISEQWLEVEQEVPLGDEGQLVGTLRGRLSDLQGRFNLNSLPGSSTDGELTAQQKQFKRLLQNLPLEEAPDDIQAEELTRSVADWIDKDNDTDPRGGAENLYYSSLEVPMLAGNGPLFSTSELLWVKGMTSEIYNELKPLVTAMLAANDSLNVNTASAPVLAAMVDGGGEMDFEQFIIDRDGKEDSENRYLEAKGYESVDNFKQDFKALTGADMESDALDIRSDTFLLTSEVLFLDRVFSMRSVLKRDGEGRVKVVARSYTDI